MYLSSHSHLRYHFWNPIRETLSLTFTNGTQNIIRAAGNWAALGYKVGMRMAVSGSMNNDRMFTIAAIPNATTIVVDPAKNGTVGEVVTVDIETEFFDSDGLERWPVEKLRINGFGTTGSTLTLIPKPALTRDPFVVTCNGGANDAVAGVDEYDWYLSQKSDDPAKQRLSLQSVTSIMGTHKSGSAVVWVYPWNSAPIAPEDLATYFKFCHLYVQRRSDKAIQWIDLYRYMTGKVAY